MAFHCWNGAVLPATRDFQATGSLASTCASRLVLHVRDMTPDNHAQGHLRCTSTLVPSLRHKRTRHTAGETDPKSSQRLCAEREEHLPHLRERCRAHATFYSPAPNQNSTYNAYNWSIQGRMRDLEGRRQRDLAGSLVRANEVASPNHALSSSSVPSQTNVHPSQRNVHPVKRSGPLLWHGERSGYGHGFGPDAWRGHDGAWRPDWHKDGPAVGGHGDIETLHL